VKAAVVNKIAYELQLTAALVTKYNITFAVEG